MSFAQLATREAAIRQSLLLAPLLADIPDETEEAEEPQLPVPVEPEPVRTAIYRPCNNFIQTTSVDTSILLPGEDFQITSVSNGNITSTYIREVSANRWYTVQSSATAPTGARSLQIITQTNGTNIATLVPYQTTTSATTGIVYDGTGTWTSVYTNTIYTNTYLTEVPCPSGGFKQRYRNEVKKTVKNSIKRALKLLDNFGMEKDTKIFLSGEDVEVSHPDSIFKFVITKRDYSNIIRETERPSFSIPFKLALFTKSGIFIATLCVYAENTPMLDQLFMIAMYVKTGNEEDLLRKANYSVHCRDQEVKEILALEYPFMKQKLLR